MSKSHLLAVFVIAASLVVGCGKKAKSGSSTTGTAASSQSSSKSVAVSTETDATPPPPAPAAAGAAPVAEVAATPAGGDEFSGLRPMDATGKPMDDLAVINDALMKWGMTGGPRPPFKGLQDLVTEKLLPRLPTPPPGKQYVFDAKTGKAKLSP